MGGVSESYANREVGGAISWRRMERKLREPKRKWDPEGVFAKEFL